MSNSSLLKPDARVLSTLNDDGSRRWLRPRLSAGRFLTARRWVAWVLIAIFVAIPHMHIYGKPAILLDIVAREFTFFGKTFLPTDTLLLALLVVGVFLTIFLATALFGRVWCGWACPQTVYMEFLFRPIERVFDGRPGGRKPLWGNSTVRAILKHVAFVAAALFLAHTFLAYFVGAEALRTWVTQSPLEHPTPFIVMALTTALMLFDFVFFREQTCIVACPYGRFQGVMLDKHSLIVTYDRARGEPRRGSAEVSLPVVPATPGAGPERLSPAARLGGAVALLDAPAETPAAAKPNQGDCVECRLCTATCPTGIDIRDGLQLECIGCAQCIDACNAVMRKLRKPEGLIRYSSQAAVERGVKRIIRPRVLVYPALLAIVFGAFLTLLLTATPADLAVLRGRGLPFNVLVSGDVANQILIKITNRSASARSYTLRVEPRFPAGIGPAIALQAERNPVTLKPGEMLTVPVLAVAAPGAFDGRGHLEARVLINDGAELEMGQDFRLMGPPNASATTTKEGRP